MARAGAGGTVREVTLYAVAGPGTRLAFGTTRENASVPGPTIEAIEGDEIRVTSKDKDELQKTMKFVKGLDLDFPVEFVNLR